MNYLDSRYSLVETNRLTRFLPLPLFKADGDQDKRESIPYAISWQPVKIQCKAHNANKVDKREACAAFDAKFCSIYEYKLSRTREPLHRGVSAISVR